jgi:hypothetical protein
MHQVPKRQVAKRQVAKRQVPKRQVPKREVPKHMCVPCPAEAEFSSCFMMLERDGFLSKPTRSSIRLSMI